MIQTTEQALHVQGVDGMDWDEPPILLKRVEQIEERNRARFFDRGGVGAGHVE